MSARDGGTADADNHAPGRRRFYLSEPPAGDSIELGGEAAHRIARVLRLPPGAEVSLFDGSGRSWPATVAAVQGRTVRLTIGRSVQHPPAAPTVLLAGMIRPNRFEWLIEKAAELGVTALVPVVCARSAVRPAEIGPSRLERWQRLAVEAAEQCGRVTIPDLRPPETFVAALTVRAGRLFVAAEPAHGAAPPLGAALRGIADAPVSLLTGPEGGFTAHEIEQARNAGARPVSLGPLILRAETAAVAALAILVDARRSP